MTIVKRYVEELNKEELKAVFNNNEKLRTDVMEDAADGELNWVGEKLDYVRSYMSGWNIGAYDRSYIIVKNHRDFLEGLQTMDNEVPAFSDEKAKRIYEAVELCRQLDETQDQLDELDWEDDEKAYNELEKEVEALTEQFESDVEQLGDMLATQLQRDLEYCYEEDNALDYFLNFYVEARMDGHTYYVNGEFELFEDTVKSYK